jgi:hypothetical protein
MVIFDNLVYKVAALLVASVLWATAQGFRSVEQGLDLPIVLEDVPPELVSVEQSAHEVNLRIVGSRAAVRQAEKNLLRYPLSLAEIKPGESRFSVTTDRLSLPRGARISARSPSTIVIQAERVQSKRVRVRADLAGELSEGLRIQEVSVEPSQVTLEGARSSMRRIREVMTDRIDLGRMRETTTLETSLILGYPHVWRQAEDESPVRVHIDVVADPQDAEQNGADAGKR